MEFHKVHENQQSNYNMVFSRVIFSGSQKLPKSERPSSHARVDNVLITLLESKFNAKCQRCGSIIFSRIESVIFRKRCHQMEHGRTHSSLFFTKSSNPTEIIFALRLPVYLETEFTNSASCLSGSRKLFGAGKWKSCGHEVNIQATASFLIMRHRCPSLAGVKT